MFVSELQTKDIVSIDGKKLGRIMDIEMDASGQINYFIVEPRKLFRIFSKSLEVKVGIRDIRKIGEDVILVELR